MISEAHRRSPNAQLRAVARQWPDFRGKRYSDGLLAWTGPLMPKGQRYQVSIYWQPSTMSLPYVTIDYPEIRPTSDGSYAEIPHLIFNNEDPTRSGLCLFDPDGSEWSPADLIAETTIPWTAEWLAYYELWHLTGKWLAPGVGYESVAALTAAQSKAVRKAIADVH